eukprot:4151476-Amphidinium_carterae.1
MKGDQVTIVYTGTPIVRTQDPDDIPEWDCFKVVKWSETRRNSFESMLTIATMPRMMRAMQSCQPVKFSPSGQP